MNYNDMVTNILLYTNESETGWVARVDDFITTAEKSISKEMQSPANLTSVDLVMTTASADTAASTQINSIDSVRVMKTSETATGPVTLMKRRDPSFIYARYSLASETGRPLHYALSSKASASGQFEVLVGPTPDVSYTLKLLYYGDFSGLVAAGTTNETWLSQIAPDAILFGALYYGYIALKGEPNLIGTYKDKFSYEVEALKHLAEHDLSNDMSGSGAKRI